MSVRQVLGQIAAERKAQDAKWGEQNHPDGTGPSGWAYQRDLVRSIAQHKAADGTVTWLDIAREEFFEAFAEEDPAQIRAELIQSAAVCVAWIEHIDRRAARKAAGDDVD